MNLVEESRNAIKICTEKRPRIILVISVKLNKFSMCKFSFSASEALTAVTVELHLSHLLNILLSIMVA